MRILRTILWIVCVLVLLAIGSVVALYFLVTPESVQSRLQQSLNQNRNLSNKVSKIGYGKIRCVGKSWLSSITKDSTAFAHVNMMGFVGMGNNPLMGCTASLAVRLSELIK